MISLSRSRRWRASMAVALCAAGLILSGCAAQARTYASVDRAAYPAGRDGVKNIIAFEARAIGVPVSLALAVAHAESNFNITAESSKGARGVMQIMPRTARLEYGIDPDLLWNPRINVRLGLHFLKRLLLRYRGRIDLALSYYNGGSAVGNLPNARLIPATYSYVSKVRRLQRHYQQKIYSGKI